MKAKIKITDELEKLHILKLLELQRGILNTQDWIDVEILASRLSVDSGLLLDVLINMGCGVIEDS